MKRKRRIKPSKKTFSLFQKTKELQNEWDSNYKFFPLNVPTILAVSLKQNRIPRTVIEEDGVGYFIHGPAGIGKSYQAACILNEICKRKMRKHGSHWVNIPKLLNDIRNSYNSNSERGEDLIHKYSTANLICLDDLGIEHTTDWVMQTLYLIINNRYENMLTTIITSNLSLEELADKFGDDRLISRIRGMCKIILLRGEDKREI